MMRGQKILDDGQINWYSDGSARLDYQMIFEDSNPSEQLNVQKDRSKDPSELLEEVNHDWEQKLEEARKKAFSEGFESGLEQGLENAKDEIENKLSSLEKALQQAHAEWLNNQKLLEPGLLDLAFEIAEVILGIPVENPAIRKGIEKELSGILHSIDEESKPQLYISESEYRYIGRLKQQETLAAFVKIQVTEECNPGEFILETDQETVVRNFRAMLQDFRNELSLPSWK